MRGLRALGLFFGCQEAFHADGGFPLWVLGVDQDTLWSCLGLVAELELGHLQGFGSSQLAHVASLSFNFLGLPRALCRPLMPHESLEGDTLLETLGLLRNARALRALENRGQGFAFAAKFSSLEGRVESR